MGDSRKGLGHIAGRVIAAVAVGDLAYRLFVRAPLRRALGIDVGHALR